MNQINNENKANNELMSISIFNQEQKTEYVMDVYGEEVKRLVFSYVKNWQLTEEVTQDVFVSVYNHIDHFKGDSSLKTWIYRICINKCKDYLRSWQYKKVKLTSFVSKEVISDHTPEAQYILSESRMIVSKAVMELPLKYREILLLYYYKDFSLNEVSVLLNVNSSTVKSRLRRGRFMLEQKLSEIGGS